MSELLFECGICMENKTIESVNFLPCIHFICACCYEKLTKNECPYCRNKITDDPESYDEAENEYDDINFELLVIDPIENRKKKKKKPSKKIFKLLDNNEEVVLQVLHEPLLEISHACSLY